jgi:hypothetical protein
MNTNSGNPAHQANYEINHDSLNPTTQSYQYVQDRESTQSWAKPHQAPGIIPYPGSNSSMAKPSLTAQATDLSYRRRPKGFNFKWALEFISLFLAINSLAAMFILLAVRDGKPLVKWGGFLTVNVLIAILTAIFKSALLFPVAEALSELKWMWFQEPHRLSDMEDYDLASRGPEGSLKFLLKRHWDFLAILGAVVTLLGIGIDPFTQLAVQNQGCQQFQPDLGYAASISRTNNYTAYNGESEQTLFVLDTPMSLAMLQGMLNPPSNDTSSLPWSCPSGNCTFADGQQYSSLAMCFSADDISNQLIARGTDPLDLSLPSGLNATDRLIEFATAQTNTTGNTVDSPLFEFQGINDGFHFAFQISWFPCIKTYSNVSISNFQLQQVTVSTVNLPRIILDTSLLEPAPWKSAWFYYSLAGNISSESNTDCSSADSPTVNKTVPARQLDDGRYYVIPLEISDTATIESDSLANLTDPSAGQNPVYFDPQCTWTVGFGASSAINQYFSQLFGTMTKPQLGNEQTVETEQLWNLELARLAQNITAITSYAQNVSNAMTAQIRANGHPSLSSPLFGQALINTTCLRSEWKFLLWNALLLVLAWGMLFGILWKSRLSANPMGAVEARSPWKSSSLALLWHGLDDNTRRRYGMLEGKSEIEQQSDLLRVQLSRVMDGRPGHMQQREPYEQSGLLDPEARTGEDDRGRFVLVVT